MGAVEKLEYICRPIYPQDKERNITYGLASLQLNEEKVFQLDS